MNTIRLNTIGDSPVVVKKGSQVQSQEKTVEITENGTTEVVPDSGFSLSKVTVNTNVESSGSTMEYLDVSGVSFKNVLIPFSVSAKTIENSIGYIRSGYFVAKLDSETQFGIPAISIDFSQLISAPNAEFEGLKTIAEYLETLGMTSEQFSAIPRITKEQFYNLEA